MTAITNDAAIEDTDELGPMTEDEAAEALLKRFLPPDEEGSDAKKPSDKEKPADKTDADADDEDADDEDAEKPADEDGDDEEGDEDESAAEKKYAEEEGVYLKVKVGEEEHDVPLKDLKRLYGQEAALTKKSMEVAEVRKKLDTDTVKQVAASDALLQRAKLKLEPFQKLDFQLLATQLPADEYTSLKQAAQAAWEDVQFLEKHLDAFHQGIKQKQDEERVEKAKEALKVLADPKHEQGIEGWSQKLYDDLRVFAVTAGAPKEVIDELTDPWAIKLIHDAMLYRKGKDKANVVTKKVKKGPTKIVKTTNSPAAEKAEGNTHAVKRSMKKLEESGSLDDAAAALEARWAKDDD